MEDAKFSTTKKADVYKRQGLIQKLIGPFEVDQRLANGVYSLRKSPPMKFHAAELKMVNQHLCPDYMRASTQIEGKKPIREYPDTEKPLYNLQEGKQNFVYNEQI